MLNIYFCSVILSKVSFDNTCDAENVIPNFNFDNVQINCDMSRNLKITKFIKTVHF